MIPVDPAPEPAGFDRRVRQRGLSALAELVGESPPESRRGPRRIKIAESRDTLRSADYPAFWVEMLDELAHAYNRVCAYSAFHIHPVTGSPTVDHFVPKTADWRLAYEWSNYRLACGVMNARKSDSSVVLDPFEIEDGWFEMEFVAFQVVPGSKLDPGIRLKVHATIRQLGLSDPLLCTVREAYVAEYLAGLIPLQRLESHAPFVARELRRQGLLLPEDTR